MKARRSILAITVVLASMSSSVAALASPGDSDLKANVDVTTTTVTPQKNEARTAERRAELDKWQAAMRIWVSGHAEAMAKYGKAVSAATKTLQANLSKATTKESRKAAITAFKVAREAAKAAREAAITALGERPVRPGK